MNKLATESLFLLEFLVDSVNLSARCKCDTPSGETCVSFQFLDNVPLDVCEADFCPVRKYEKECGNIKSGKSCLFSLTPEQANTATKEFDVCLKIFKRVQQCRSPEEVQIGNAGISVADLFTELLESVEICENSSPTAKTLKDSLDIVSPSGSNVGKIDVYIRLTCFGKLIVTQFQMNLADETVLFKDKEGKSLYRYRKAKKSVCEHYRETNQVSSGYNKLSPSIPFLHSNAANTGTFVGMNMGRNMGCGMDRGFTFGMGGGNSTCPTVPCPPANGAYNPACPVKSCGQILQEQMMGGIGGCPFGSCPIDRLGNASLSSPKIPCPECGQLQNPLCLPPGARTFQMPGMMGLGVMNGMGATGMGGMGGFEGMGGFGGMGVTAGFSGMGGGIGGMNGIGVMGGMGGIGSIYDNGAPCNECAYLPYAPCQSINLPFKAFL